MAIEIHLFPIGNTSSNGGFSIAMLVYRRVSTIFQYSKTPSKIHGKKHHTYSTFWKSPSTSIHPETGFGLSRSPVGRFVHAAWKAPCSTFRATEAPEASFGKDGLTSSFGLLETLTNFRILYNYIIVLDNLLCMRQLLGYTYIKYIYILDAWNSGTVI